MRLRLKKVKYLSPNHKVSQLNFQHHILLPYIQTKKYIFFSFVAKRNLQATYECKYHKGDMSTLKSKHRYFIYYHVFVHYTICLLLFFWSSCYQKCLTNKNLTLKKESFVCCCFYFFLEISSCDLSSLGKSVWSAGYWKSRGNENVE